MFKFDFNRQDLEDDDLDDADLIETDGSAQGGENVAPVQLSTGPSAAAGVHIEFTLDDLMAALPPKISYSPSKVTLADGDTELVLPRRDLFDVRFQLISEDDSGVTGANSDSRGSKADLEDTLRFIDAPSDVVSGVYEGGLKIWECSLDLVAYMHRRKVNREWLTGKAVLELGCGTALPSMYALHELLSRPISATDPASGPSVLHLQDYNSSVVQFITFPNALLTWYFSPASQAYRVAVDNGSTLPNANTPGELEIDDGLLDAFKASLAVHNIALRFSSGAWANFRPHGADDDRSDFDLILTSETIYQPSSTLSLISILQTRRKRVQSLDGGGPDRSIIALDFVRGIPQPFILVAAKVVYFGVGGGVKEFMEAVETAGGKAEVVWEITLGVARQVVQVMF
ncbi:hypothetical protein FRB99_002414 [Tulasnella sp. 403]|nr:hypothetical protein FRB99_002414 [Tulasnella sp. 403]